MPDGISFPFLLIAGTLVGATVSATMPEPTSTFGPLWQFLGCLSGAITALSIRPYKNMGRPQIVLSFIVSFSFAFLVTPNIFGMPTNTRLDGGIYYAMATASFALIPLVVKRMQAIFSAAFGDVGSQPGDNRDDA